MRAHLFLTTSLCCGVLACQPPADGSASDQSGSTVSFRLEANADGDLERCKDDGQCETVSNLAGCATLVVSVDTDVGQTCERCETDSREVLYDRCNDTDIICDVVIAPNPDCVVCAHNEGPIVFSSCIANDDGICRDDKECPGGMHCEGSSLCPSDVDCIWSGEPGKCVADDSRCSEQECGPLLRCPIYECWDGSWGGCVNECLRDSETGECGRPVRECPPRKCEDSDCGRSPCPSKQCSDGSWTTDCSCEYNPSADACHWEPINSCDDWCDPNTLTSDTVTDACEGRCRWDSDCSDGTHCEGSSVCAPGAECGWAGEPGRCVPDSDPCSFDECGPPPPCGAPMECKDGSYAGCSCERDPASGSCGWVNQGCAELSPSSEDA